MASEHAGGEMPETLHRIRRALRRALRRFETSREDAPPYPASWTLTVNIWPDELDGGFVAQCVELPGCISEGDTVEEAFGNITSAVEEMLEVIVRDSVLAEPRATVPEPPGEVRSIKIAVGT